MELDLVFYENPNRAFREIDDYEQSALWNFLTTRIEINLSSAFASTLRFAPIAEVHYDTVVAIVSVRGSG